jgi:hypothetical protein
MPSPHSRRYKSHINSLKIIAELTGLPNTFRVPYPFPEEYEHDFKIFMRYMRAYPGIWNDIQRVEYIPPLP